MGMCMGICLCLSYGIVKPKFYQCSRSSPGLLAEFLMQNLRILAEEFRISSAKPSKLQGLYTLRPFG